MRHLMICISGWARTGKDTACEHLVRSHHAVQTGLADVGKRYAMEVYGFTYEQVFGPSEMRNAGDPRLPKNIYGNYECESCKVSDLPDSYVGPTEGMHFIDLDSQDIIKEKLEAVVTKLPNRDVGAGFRRYFFHETNPAFFLSPREVLQKHLEQFNEMYINTWIRKGLDLQVQLADVRHEHHGWSRKYDYVKEKGLVEANSDHWFSSAIPVVTCFSDFRHIHEYKLSRQYNDDDRRVVLVRIKRPGIDTPPFDHRSETEQCLVRDAAFDFVLNNNASLQDLYMRVDAIIKTASDPTWQPKKWDDSFVVRSHNPQLGYIE